MKVARALNAYRRAEAPAIAVASLILKPIRRSETPSVLRGIPRLI